MDCFVPNKQVAEKNDSFIMSREAGRQQALYLCQTAGVYGAWLRQFVEAELSL